MKGVYVRGRSSFYSGFENISHFVQAMQQATQCGPCSRCMCRHSKSLQFTSKAISTCTNLLCSAPAQVNAVIMNHGGPTTSEKVRAVKKPFMVNGSDNDNSIPKDLLDEIKSTLDNMPDVPSDVKVQLIVCILHSSAKVRHSNTFAQGRHSGNLMLLACQRLKRPPCCSATLKAFVI